MKVLLPLRLTLTARGVSSVQSQFVTMSDDFQPVPVAPASSRPLMDEVDELTARVLDSPTDAEYAREYAALVSRNRRQSYTHVLRHATHYPPGTLATILARPIMRRLRGQ
jgi:hypothetical protein